MKKLLKNNDFKFDNILSGVFKLLKFVGFRFDNDISTKQWIKYLQNFYSVLVIFCYVVIVLLSYLFIIFDEGPFQTKIKAITICLVFLELITKIFAIWRNREKICAIFKEFNEIYRDDEVSSDTKLFVAKTSRLINTLILTSLLCCCFLLMAPFFVSVINFFKTGVILKNYPFDLWLPFETSTLTFFLVYILESYWGATTATYFIATEATIFIFLSVINNRLEEVSKSFLSVNERSFKIKELVRNHLSVLE